MSSSSITGIFTQFTQSQPEQIAIDSASGPVNYSQLGSAMNRTAGFLLKRSHTATNPIVLIILDRSPEMIISILGVMKAGLVFAPVNPAFPSGRVKYIIKETGSQCIITSAKYADFCRQCIEESRQPVDLIMVEEVLISAKPDSSAPLAEDSVDNDFCYIYFTSGSTGTPKGILGSQKGLLHFIKWEIQRFGISEDVRGSQLTTPSFDPYLRDILVPLLAGGCCCIPSFQTIMEPSQLIRWLDEREISLMHIVPSLFKTMSAAISVDNYPKSLKHVLLAGEMLRGNDIRHFESIMKDRVQLVNLYGPTETTLAKLFYILQPGDGERSVIPVGQAIPGARAMVFDPKTQRGCRPGKIGEIIIRTPYRSYGYINDHELNRQMFTPNPFSNDHKDIIYKTGDLGRMLPDNNIELTGRIGQQVKIRGHRIEPGEIESRLLTLDDLKEAIVMALSDDGQDYYLCAFLLPRQPRSFTLDADCVRHIKEHLSGLLPDYMVPPFYVLLNQVPLNHNGKTDRFELKKMAAGKVSAHQFVAPTDAMERRMAEIWAGILAMETGSIGLESNFFELGGHSLKAIDLAARIKKSFQVDLPLGEIFTLQTMGKLARYVKNAAPTARYLEIQAVESKEYHEPSSGQKRHYFMQQVDPDSTAYNIFRTYNMDTGVDPEKLSHAFQVLVNRHECLRTSFIIVDRHPVQRVHPAAPFNMELYTSQSDKQTGELVHAFNRPFDLSRAPLIKAGLIDRAGKGYLLMVSIHHIITDAVSNAILMEDLNNIYYERPLPALTLQYKDYSWWQNRLMESGELQKQERYWLDHLKGNPPMLQIPADFPRPEKRSYNGASYLFLAHPELYRQLQELAARENVTLAMVLLSAYYTMLFKITGQQDIVVGSPITGRGHEGLEHVVGMLVNMLPMRGFPQPGKSFKALLKETRDSAVQSYENQDYPFEKIVAKLEIQRRENINPLFDVVFEFVTFDNKRSSRENAAPSKNSEKTVPQPFRFENKITPFDLILLAYESSNGLGFNFTYSTSLFKAATVEDFANHYIQILEQAVAGSDRQLDAFAAGHQLVSADTTMFEKDQMEFEF